MKQENKRWMELAAELATNTHPGPISYDEILLQ